MSSGRAGPGRARQGQAGAGGRTEAQLEETPSVTLDQGFSPSQAGLVPDAFFQPESPQRLSFYLDDLINNHLAPRFFHRVKKDPKNCREWPPPPE